MDKIYFGKEEEKVIWASTRSAIELDNFKYKKNGKKSRSHWNSFEKILHYSGPVLNLLGILKRGKKNALNIHKTKLELEFENLPTVFNGFKILHLSDIHIDALPDLTQSITDVVSDEKYDLCVMTGDYRFHDQGNYKQIIEPLKKIAKSIKSEHGILAVFGNHDTFRILNYQDEMGIHFLVNESVSIKRSGEQITITGTDDPFKFFTQCAVDALEKKANGFKIALIHTTELCDIAEKNGYSLYLCGHTHGGQICLPGGVPLVTHQYEGRKFYHGLWHLNKMTGYTSNGCGVSGIPLRFYTRGEIAQITLKSKSEI